MTFKYLRDPLFLFCLGLYFVNRLVLKPLIPGGFVHEHLNDVICIPFWVPIMVWGMRKLRMRDNDAIPHWYEILFPVLVWSFVFEVWLPRVATFRHVANADPADILAYVSGAALTSIFWHHWYSPLQKSQARI